MNQNILVAYYSWSGNTAKIAEMIAEITGGTPVEINPETPYTKDYNAVVEQGKREINAGYLPPLKETVEGFEGYDVVFVGCPNWWSTMAPPVASFLSSHDFSQKTVVPFCTHGGGGRARVLSDMGKSCPGANLLEGFDVYDGGTAKTREDVERWLKEIGVVE